MQRIMCVDSVTVFTLESDPPQVGIFAVGKVPTTGWTHPELSPWFYLVPPKDGIQDFDFVAEPPTGIALNVVSPIAAHAFIARDPNNYWGKGKPLVGVRIHARENSLVGKADPKAKPEKYLDARGGEVPWPWVGRGVHRTGEDPFPLQPMFAGGGSEPFPFGLSLLELLMIGKILRVYNTGDALTKDRRPDRVNIELNPATERIVHVWIG